MSTIFRVDFFGSQTSERTPVFFAGQNIHARVVLHLPEPMKARSIDLHICGKAEVEWTETETTRSTDINGKEETKTETIYFRSEGIYLNKRIQLWASSDKQKIAAGEHIFPFQFTVPPHCPQSFEGSYGHIRYHCSVSIDRPWNFDKKIKSLFVVSPFVDLNSIGWALEPVEQQIDKSIGILMFKHGRIAAKIRLSKSGFVPGERIPFSIDIDNGTTKEVKIVKAKLLENMVYIARRDFTLHCDFTANTDWNKSKRYSTKHSSRKIAHFEKPFMVAPQSKGTYQDNLLIPSCVPSFNSCPLIRLSYVLEIKLETTSTFGSTASVQFPLLIGTIPIRQKQFGTASSLYPSLNPPAFPQPNAPSFNDVSSPSSSASAGVMPSAPPYYFENPLPTYEEVLSGSAAKTERR